MNGRTRRDRPVVEAPQVVGRHVFLRPLVGTDYDFLYHLETSDGVGFRWRMQGASPNPDEFSQTIWNDVLVQFMIQRRDHEDPVGLVSAFNPNMRDGHAYLGIVTDPRYHGSGWAMEGLALFVDYLFKLWQFRKLYAESIAYNYEAFARGAGRYFREEACLKEHHAYAGRFWDLHIMAVYREDWAQVRELMRATLVDATNGGGQSW